MAISKLNTPFNFLFKSIVFILTFSLIFSPSMSYAQTVFNLPTPGAMVMPTNAFVPAILKGMTIHPEDPLKFDFIIDSGHSELEGEALKEESNRLIKYFLASLTVPKDELWVNLSPYEQNRIIPEALGKTELGRDLLAQDYILKQLTASLMYPEDELGQEFWEKVYKEAKEKYGTTDIPLDTFNKVWILPETASVYENGATVYVVESKLKVMLEEDYKSAQWSVLSGQVSDQKKHSDHSDSLNTGLTTDHGSLTTKVVREIIIPAIEREVNEGKNFATLRQIYNSLILAKWYKETIKESILSKTYVDRNKTVGINIDDPKMKDKIYEQYMQAYKKGVYNYIKEDYDPATQDIIPRKYFSGGFRGDVNVSKAMMTKDMAMGTGQLSDIEVQLDRQGKDNAMLVEGIALLGFAGLWLGYRNSLSWAVEVLHGFTWYDKKSEARAEEIIKNSKNLKKLIKLLDDKDHPVRRLAAEGLGNLRDKKAVDALISKLEDEVVFVRQSVIEALGKIGDKKAVNSLIPFLSLSSSKRVAAEALGKLGDEKVGDLLIPFLNDQDKDMVISVARALGDLGDKKAIKVLKPLLNNDNQKLIKAAREALDKLGMTDEQIVEWENILQSWKKQKEYLLFEEKRQLQREYSLSQEETVSEYQAGEENNDPVVGYVETYNPNEHGFGPAKSRWPVYLSQTAYMSDYKKYEDEDSAMVSNQLEILKEFGIVNPLNPTILKGGIGSEIPPLYFETENGSKWVLRNFRWGNIDSTRFIVSVINHLNNNGMKGITKLYPKKGTSGEKIDDFIFYTDKGSYLVEQFMEEGKTIRVKDMEIKHYEALGKLGAEFNNAVWNFTPEGKKTWKTPVEISEDLKSKFDKFYQSILEIPEGERKSGHTLFLENWDFFNQQFELIENNFPKEGLFETVIQGDLHVGNVKFDENTAVKALLDFDYTHMGLRVYEFNNMIMAKDNLSEPLPYAFEKLVTIISSYNAALKNKLTDNEIRAIVEIIRLRFLSEVEAHLIRKGQMRLNIFDYPEKEETIRGSMKLFKEFAQQFSSEQNVNGLIEEVREMSTDKAMSADVVQWIATISAIGLGSSVFLAYYTRKDLITLLISKDSDKKLNAIYNLAKAGISSKYANFSLTLLLRDNDPNVQVAAATALLVINRDPSDVRYIDQDMQNIMMILYEALPLLKKIAEDETKNILLRSLAAAAMVHFNPASLGTDGYIVKETAVPLFIKIFKGDIKEWEDFKMLQLFPINRVEGATSSVKNKWQALAALILGACGSYSDEAVPMLEQATKFTNDLSKFANLALRMKQEFNKMRTLVENKTPTQYRDLVNNGVVQKAFLANGKFDVKVVGDDMGLSLVGGPTFYKLEIISHDLKDSAMAIKNPIGPLSVNAELKIFIEEYLTKRYVRWGLPVDLAKRIVQALVNNVGNIEKGRRDVYENIIDFDTDAAWNKAYKIYKDATKYDSAYNQIKPYIENLPQDSIILDLGAGNNLFGEVIARNLPSTNVIGVDVIDYHENRNLPNLSYLKQTTPTKLPDEIKEHSVDVLIMNAVLHHVSSELVPDFMKEIKRILKPYGKVILIEDTYSTKLPFSGDSDVDLNNKFLILIGKYGDQFARDFFAFNDWYSNIFVHKWDSMATPYEFKSIEEWQEVFKKNKFITFNNLNLGFPKEGFHKPGLGIMVFNNPSYITGTIGDIEVMFNINKASNTVVIYDHGLGGDINNLVGEWIDDKIGLDVSTVRFTSSRFMEKSQASKTGAQWIADMFGKKGYEKIKTFEDEKDDLRIVIKESIERLKNSGKNEKDIKIILVGESLGAQIVPIIAHEFKQVKGIISIVGSMETISQGGRPKTEWEPILELPSVEKMGQLFNQFKGSSLILQAENDYPLRNDSSNLWKKYANSKELIVYEPIPGGHSISNEKRSDTKTAVQELIKRFIASLDSDFAMANDVSWGNRIESTTDSSKWSYDLRRVIKIIAEDMESYINYIPPLRKYEYYNAEGGLIYTEHEVVDHPGAKYGLGDIIPVDSDSAMAVIEKSYIIARSEIIKTEYIPQDGWTPELLDQVSGMMSGGMSSNNNYSDWPTRTIRAYYNSNGNYLGESENYYEDGQIFPTDSAMLTAPEVIKFGEEKVGVVIPQAFVPEKGFQIFTNDENPFGIKIFVKQKDTLGDKHIHNPIEGNNPFGDRPRQEVLRILSGKIEARFFNKDNEYIGSEILNKGDTVLFTEIHQVVFLEDTTFLEILQGPYPGTREKDKIILKEDPLSAPVGEINKSPDNTAITFTKDGRLIGAVVRADHSPKDTIRFTKMEDPISFNSFSRQKGQKGKRLYHTAVPGENPFGDLPRQEVLMVLNGKIKVDFYTKNNEFAGTRIVGKGETVLITQGHVVEFLEDTVILEAKQGPYPGDSDKDSVYLPETDSAMAGKEAEDILIEKLANNLLSPEQREKYTSDLIDLKENELSTDIIDSVKQQTLPLASEEVEYLREKSVMITGGLGFIGLNLAAKILSETNADKIILVDSIDKNPTFKFNRTQNIIEANDTSVDVSQEVVQAINAGLKNGRILIQDNVDIADINSIEQAFDSTLPDIVFHLAAERLNGRAQEFSVNAVQTNITGTQNLISLADKYEVERFVFASTAQSKTYYDERVYPLTKFIAERLVYEAANKDKIKTNFSIVRNHQVLENSMLVQKGIKDKIAKNEEVTIFYQPGLEIPIQNVDETTSLFIKAGNYGQGGEVYGLNRDFDIKNVTPLNIALQLIREHNKTSAAKGKIKIILPPAGYVSEIFKGFSSEELDLKNSIFNLLEVENVDQWGPPGIFYAVLLPELQTKILDESAKELSGIQNADQVRQKAKEVMGKIAFDIYSQEAMKTLVDILKIGIDPENVRQKITNPLDHEGILKILLTIINEKLNAGEKLGLDSEFQEVFAILKTSFAARASEPNSVYGLVSKIEDAAMAAENEKAAASVWQTNADAAMVDMGTINKFVEIAKNNEDLILNVSVLGLGTFIYFGLWKLFSGVDSDEAMLTEAEARGLIESQISSNNWDLITNEHIQTVIRMNGKFRVRINPEEPPHPTKYVEGPTIIMSEEFPPSNPTMLYGTDWTDWTPASLEIIPLDSAMLSPAKVSVYKERGKLSESSATDFDSQLAGLYADRSDLLTWSFNDIKSRQEGEYIVKQILGRTDVNSTTAPATSEIQVVKEFDETAFHFDKPFLMNGRMMELELMGANARINLNINPEGQEHFLFLPEIEKHLPQVITEKHLRMALEMFTLSKDSRLMFGHNSLDAGGVANSLHIHGFYFDKGLLPVERQIVTTVNVFDDVKINKVYGYPALCYVFESWNNDSLAKVTGDFIKSLQDANIPYNILVTRQGIYVFPRKSAGINIGKYFYNFGFFDMAGEVIVPEGIFSTVTEEELAAAFRLTSADEKVTDDIVQKMTDNDEKDSAMATKANVLLPNAEKYLDQLEKSKPDIAAERDKYARWGKKNSLEKLNGKVLRLQEKWKRASTIGIKDSSGYGISAVSFIEPDTALFNSISDLMDALTKTHAAKAGKISFNNKARLHITVNQLQTKEADLEKLKSSKKEIEGMVRSMSLETGKTRIVYGKDIIINLNARIQILGYSEDDQLSSLRNKIMHGLKEMDKPTTVTDTQHINFGSIIEESTQDELDEIYQVIDDWKKDGNIAGWFDVNKIAIVSHSNDLLDKIWSDDQVIELKDSAMSDRIVARIESSVSEENEKYYENFLQPIMQHNYYNSAGELIYSETEELSQIGSTYHVGDYIGEDSAMLGGPWTLSGAREVLDSTVKTGRWLPEEKMKRAISILKEKGTKDDETRFIVAGEWHLQSNQRNEYEQAIKMLEKALAINPNNVLVLNNIGNAYKNLHQYEKAKAYFLKVISIDNNYDPAYRNMAKLLQEINRPEEAKDFYSKAIKLNPNNPVAKNNLGYLFYEAEDYNSAKMYLLQAINLNPDYSVAHNNLGLVYLASGDYEKARYHFNKAMEIDPKNYGVLDNIELLERKLKDPSLDVSAKSRKAFNKMYLDSAMATKAEVVKLLNETRVVAGLHTKTGGRFYDGTPALRLAEIASELSQKNITPILDNLPALKIFREKYPNAIVGFFIDHIKAFNKEEAFEALSKYGVKLIYSLSNLTEEQVNELRNVKEDAVIVSMIKLDAADVDAEIEEALKTKIDGIQFGAWGQKISEEGALEPVKTVRQDHPELIISAAGGLFDNNENVEKTLSMTENIIAAIGINSKEVDDVKTQIAKYKSKIDPILAKDKAMAGLDNSAYDIRPATYEKPGGIDMNNIDVNRKGNVIENIKFDANAINDVIEEDIQGFAPIILRITPIQSVLPLLGLDKESKDKEEQKVSMNVQQLAEEPRQKQKI